VGGRAWELEVGMVGKLEVLSGGLVWSWGWEVGVKFEKFWMILKILVESLSF